MMHMAQEWMDEPSWMRIKSHLCEWCHWGLRSLLWGERPMVCLSMGLACPLTPWSYLKVTLLKVGLEWYLIRCTITGFLTLCLYVIVTLLLFCIFGFKDQNQDTYVPKSQRPKFGWHMAQWGQILKSWLKKVGQLTKDWIRTWNVKCKANQHKTIIQWHSTPQEQSTRHKHWGYFQHWQ